MGSQSPLAVPSGVFASADGHIQVVAYSERQWRAICAALGHTEWLDDPRSADARARLAHRDLVHERLAAVLATATTAHWVDAIIAAGGLAERVREVDEAWRDPQLRERGLLGHLDDAELGGLPLPTLALSGPRRADPSFRAPAPALGEHTDAVLAELARAASSPRKI